MEDGSAELRAYLRLFLGWWWLFVLGAAVAGAAAYYITIITPPVFKARAYILVESNQKTAVPSGGDILTNQNLAANYVSLVKRRPILSKILEEVAPSLPEGYKLNLRRNLDVRSVPSPTGGFTNLIQITVSDGEPAIAANVANVTAETFIAALLERQLSQLIRFQEVLGEYGIQQDPQVVAQQAAGLGILSILEPAVPPRNAANKSLLQLITTMAVGMALGLFIPGLAIALKEYLDDRIRSPDKLKIVTGMPPLASVPHYRGRHGSRFASNGHDPRNGAFAESYNLLLANLQFAPGNEPKSKALLITSPGISEGKSSTATNLAISAARQGKSVILVDCDLRSPVLHRVFELGDQIGLNQLLTGGATLEEALAGTPIEGLELITSGPPLLDPVVALSSPGMNALVQELKQRSALVILDSPSLDAVTDPLLLAPLVDEVLLVVDANRTTSQSVKQATEMLRQVDANVVGGVLNNVKSGGKPKGYDHYYQQIFEESRPKRRFLGLPSLPRLRRPFR